MPASRTAIAAFTLLTSLAPLVSLAIEPPVDDGMATLCIFNAEDAAAAGNAIEYVVPFVTYRMFFVLYNEQIASDTLGAMAFSWRLEPAPVFEPVVTLNLPPQALNIGTRYNVIMGFGLGVPTIDDHAIVLTIDITFISAVTSPIYVFLGPPVPADIPGDMNYSDYENPGIVLPARPFSQDGDCDNPVFAFGVAVATEAETWSGVKSLFR